MHDQSTPLTRKEIRHRSYLRSKGIDVPRAKTGYEARPVAERSCEQCGQAFTPETHSSPQRFCSKDCATANIKGRAPRGPKTARPEHLELSPADIERYWSKVDRSGGADACWPWTAGRFPNGYGQFKLRGIGPIQAHRVAWAIAHDGNLPHGLLILHRCDNRLCQNGAHHFDGTHQDNMDDMVAKGRQSHGAKAARTGAILREEDIPEIRRRVANGETHEMLALQFGVARTTITAIVNQVTWRHVP